MRWNRSKWLRTILVCTIALLFAAGAKAQAHPTLASEPENLALVGAGLLLLGLTLRRRVPKQAVSGTMGAAAGWNVGATGSSQ